MNYRIHVDGEPFDVTVEEVGGRTVGRQFQVDVAGVRFHVEVQAEARRSAPVYSVELGHHSSPAATPIPTSPVPSTHKESTDVIVTAPMAGMIIQILVDEGQFVDQGDQLFLLEAMKMENSILSPAAGTVAQIQGAVGRSVRKGDVLAVIVRQE